ncbi:RNA-guided endonuclease InsQ/TnpB family protein [Avibacterium paragallinarum]|uniref:RNA-guided endonuclease InsQ/TnpB family protein n=1 Tax=Avibacterium paragallinarum TaxID=728 RepID=UPI00021AD334|nr:RNA-guided endonuclease TnpB family protein [Avibacterium paragallinarum]AZI15196.1 transposase [Avibacterium paragallinarum]QIR13059.1 transposase [Avibacterium paragallinarum]QJE11012.1 transposase [Avibacterium paragallinarum]QJE13209.1 transposase [Avibacterium paragallinarum]QJE15408.1 transposase [Avibacterium paragallinarum]
MQLRKAFKFEIMPNGSQIRRIKQFCGCSRFVFNRALAWQNEQYEQDNSFKFSYTKIANLLPQWKKELVWLKECHSQVLQQSLKDLESAFKNFFQKRADFPKFKKKGMKESFRFPQGCKLEQQNNRLYLPKIGWIRYRNSRDIVGEIKNVTVSQKCGRFFVSIQTEFEYQIPIHNGGEIGIDMGVARFATLSNGEFFEPLNAFKTYKGKLAKLQKRLKNKVKFSQNWQKLKAKIAKLHHKITNCRKDFLHKISTQISKNHAMIYIEALQVANMSKSAKGTVEQHGKNVAAKSGLNRAILDQSWFEFRRQLDYKTQWQGGFLVAVPPQNSSRTCPCCGHVAKENRQTQANFECVECGYTENADVVGALNVLGRGRAIVHA